MRTQIQGELDPTRNEDTIEVTMRNNDDVAVAGTLLKVFPMDFLNLVDDSVDTFCHILGTFSSGTASD